MADPPKRPVVLSFATSLALAIVVVMSRIILEEVEWPSDQLTSDQYERGDDWGFFSEFRQLPDFAAYTTGVDLAGFGEEDHVALHVARGLMVFAMGYFPGEIGDEERGVKDPAHSVVEGFGGREGLVPAFVGEDPETGGEDALEEAVERPEEVAEED